MGVTLMRSYFLFLVADTPQIPERTNEKLAVGYGQRGIGLFAGCEGVGGQQLERLWAGLEDECLAATHQDIKPSLRVDHRTPGGSSGTRFHLPDFLAADQLVT